MAIYDLGTASLAANGEVTGVGTTWKAPLTLIRVGATIVFKTEPVQIYTIAEIISDTQVNVYNPNSETVPAGTGYAILAHDGITVQGLAQDVAETLRYYQSRETEVADAIEAFNNFDSADFESKVSQVNTQYGDVLSISAQVSSDASQVSSDASQVYNNLKQSISSANSASDSALRAENAASELSGATIFSFSTGGVVNSKSQQVVLIEGESASSYLWSGDLPKVVPQDSSPESTGGVGLGAWIQLGSSSSDHVADVTKSVFSGGAKLDGVTNDLGAFIACANFASANKLPVYFPPFSKMKISGSDNVVLTSGAIFNGSTIDISEYAGQIRMQRQVTGVTYGVSSSLITNIRNGSALTGYYWPSVVNNSEIENCYLNVVTTQPYYTYRGNVVNRTERLISVRHGIMDGILRYPLTGNLVSSIVAYKLPATWIQYSDVNFKVGLNQLQNSPVYVEADMVQLKNWTFEQTNGIYTTANPLYVAISNSSRVIVENFNTMWTNRTSSNNFTYIIACEYSCDVKFINCRGVGDGWGMTGFNENRKVVFDGCNLSRIDSHQPFIERLDIINCQLAQHGIHFTALADVNIEGGSINLSNDPIYTDKVGFITLRDECGGMADGWLNIYNLSLSNRTSTATQSLVLHRGSASGAPPTGSPVNFRCFSSVNVNGLKSDDRIVNVMPQVNSASGAKYPESVTVTNCQEGIYSISADISANTPANALSSTVAGYTTNVSNLKVTVNNVNIQSNITLIDTSSPQRWQCDVSLIRLIGGQSFNPGLLCKFGGVLSISHSIVEGFDFYSGTALDRYLRVNVTGGAVRHTGRFRTVPFNGVNSMVDITFNGVHCEASSLSQLRVYAQAYLCGCSYSISGSAPTRSLPMTDDGSVSTDTGVALINTRNSFVTTVSVSGKLRRAPFYLPQSGGSSYVQLDNGVFATVGYSGSTITVTTTGGLGNVSIV